VSTRGIVFVVLAVGVASFILGRASGSDTTHPLPSSASTPSVSPTVKRDVVFVNRIPRVCSAAIYAARFEYNDLTDPDFIRSNRRFLKLSTDSSEWLNAAKDLAFRANSSQLGWLQVPGPRRSIPRCFGLLVDQNSS